MTDNDLLSKHDKEMIHAALKTSTDEYFAISSISNFLYTLWGDTYEEELDLDFDLEADEELAVTAEDEADELDFSMLEESEIWMIGFSPEFKKSIKRVEKKLKGRILDALEWLSREPVTTQGNTVKPLSGEFAGLWRYRIGNYRLIYKPDSENKRVTLLFFSSRSSAY